MKTDGVISIEGFNLAYTIEGERFPVLVVGSAIYYPRLFDQETRKKLQLIFIDTRSFVPSPRELQPADYSIERILADIEIMRERLGLVDFVIMGHSGTSFLALEYAIRYPQHVRKVVLCNTAPTNSAKRQLASIAAFEEEASPDRKSKFEADFALLPGDLEEEPERRFAHMCIRMGAHSFYDYNFDASPLWEGVYTNMPIIDYLWGEAFGQINMLERLASVEKPVFLGLGRYDYLVGPLSLWDGVEEMHPHVKKIVFEQSGHNPMLEEPYSFCDRLVNWLNEGLEA
jgi:proline iminopeptidase